MSARKTVASKNTAAKQSADLYSDGNGPASGIKPQLSNAITISPQLQLLLIISWIVLIFGAYGDLPSRQLESYRALLGGREMFSKLFSVLAGIHAVEVVVVAAVSLWKRLALDDVIPALAYTALYGVHGSIPFLKVALNQ
ncbi:hypothetical protein HDU87_000898 [Geranomyces variabilis]|uniref:Uncharacterized protein n=1 Tax=Geranomyces variabilis TaxID=109894 RepID=A0AAD5XLK8_9FUNG|nr:hypothetical protein HDU87_000898 [Geranomyces variabilis]